MLRLWMSLALQLQFLGVVGSAGTQATFCLNFGRNAHGYQDIE
jgi:hypothetical protein